MERRIIFADTKITSRIWEGYGQGGGAGYKSWLKVGDFPICETEHITSSMEDKHPKNIGDHNSCVMTADFLVIAKKSETKRKSLHGCSLIAK